jgi:hypothetical protein
MEVLYDPETWDWDREVVGELAVAKFVDVCNEQRRTYLRDSDEPALEPAAQEDYDERVELGKGMLRYYYKKQLPKHPEGFRPIRVEIAFEVPIMHPDIPGRQLMCKCDSCWTRYKADAESRGEDVTGSQAVFWAGLPVVYAGRLDCLGEDAQGDLWIIDWKTARVISDDDEFLHLDDQIGSYCWALTELGLPIRGFIYHEQKKGYPQPPNENKFLRKGCRFSVSKQQDTDYETYLAHIKEHDPQALAEGAYDDFLNYLKNEGIVYYRRWQIIKTDYEKKMIAKDIGLEALDMLDTQLRIYPNAGRFSCTYCAFRQPCLGRKAGEDYEYTLKTLFKQEAPYYYRQQQGASTESKGGE